MNETFPTTSCLNGIFALAIKYLQVSAIISSTLNFLNLTLFDLVSVPRFCRPN
jgi:hypothetical protein